LVIKSDGAIFFTDPDFNIPSGESKELSFNGVYRISPSGVLQLLTSSLTLPNGICFSPDESKLYVNALRIYDFFGLDWRLPLWDRDYVDFWTRVPLDLRLGRSLMKQYASKCQSVPIPAYNDYPLGKKLHLRYQRAVSGNLSDQRYGRFLDYRDRQGYLHTKVASLLVPNLAYPDFVNPDLNLLDANINAVAEIAAELALTGNSRQDERAADAQGLRFMSRAGYDPEAMVRFFERLLKATGDLRGLNRYFATHPLTSDRIARARELIEKEHLTVSGHRPSPADG